MATLSGTPFAAAHASCAEPSSPPSCAGETLTVYASWPATFDGSAPEIVQFLPSSVMNFVISSTVGTAWSAGRGRRVGPVLRQIERVRRVRRRVEEGRLRVVPRQLHITGVGLQLETPAVRVPPEPPGRAGHQRRADLADERPGGEELVREGDPRRHTIRLRGGERVVRCLCERLRGRESPRRRRWRRRRRPRRRRARCTRRLRVMIRRVVERVRRIFTMDLSGSSRRPLCPRSLKLS